MNKWINFFNTDGDNSHSSIKAFARTLNASVIVLTLIAGLSGFFFMGTDLWDGVVVAHTVTTGRPDVYHEWFSEAGLFFTPYIYDVVYLGRTLVGYELLAKFFTILFLILASAEIAKLATSHYRASKKIALYAAILFFLSPAWVLYYSNIYLMHSFSLFLTLISTRYILERRFLWLALPALLLSFQQSSDAPLAISLVLLSSIYIHTNHKDRILNAAVIGFIIAGFFLLRKLFPTYGIYEDYNKIELQNILNIKNYLRYLKYFILLYLPFIAAIALPLLLSRSLDIAKLFTILFLGIMLNGVAYVAVGKLPFTSEIGLMHAESLRFTFTSTVFAAFLFPVCWQALAAFPKAREYIMMFLMIYTCGLNIHAHEGKMKEVLFQRGMIFELQKLQNLPECIINIKSEKVSVLTVYEYGDIFYKAFGKSAHLAIGDSVNPESEADKLYNDLPTESYRYKYFLPQQKPSCVASLMVSTDIAQWPLLKVALRYFTNENASAVEIRLEQ